MTSLAPGEYRIYVSKYRFDFGSGASLAHLEEQIGVGPSNSGNDYLGVYVAP